MVPVIIVQGGAGLFRPSKVRRQGVTRAAKSGYSILVGGGSCLDAVERAVMIMEDDPVFNAGTGSTLSFNGKVEMDATVMTDDLQCGGVAAIRDVKNPICVARKVMEETDHLLLAGEGAVRFARKIGFKPYNPITEHNLRKLKRGLQRMTEGKSSTYFPKQVSVARKLGNLGTVGAVALDQRGRIAVATSTGGIFLRMDGRVGDSAIIGAGTYANSFGGASATGHGEWIMRLCIAWVAVDLMRRLNAQAAVDRTMKLAERHGCRCGLIAIDRRGRVGFGHTTKLMAYAYIRDGNLTVF
jgi:beta-aspartyl-peptidase (threonine type)